MPQKSTKNLRREVAQEVEALPLKLKDQVQSISGLKTVQVPKISTLIYPRRSTEIEVQKRKNSS